jgi:protein TonB
LAGYLQKIQEVDMFEQSVVEARALTARPWTLAVSVMGQAVLVTAAVVLPMLHPETLKRVVMLVPIGGPPRAYHPPAPEKVEPGRLRAATSTAPRLAFVQPTAIPRGIPAVQNELPEFGGSVVGSAEDGVIGGIDMPGTLVGAGPVRIAPPADPPPLKAIEHRAVTPPPPAPPKQVTRGGEVQASLLIFKPEPVYPPLAKQARVSGTVRLSAIISTDGRIAQLRAMSGHPLLVTAAMDAVKRWAYSPTLLNGVPVEVITEVTVTFTLN